MARVAVLVGSRGRGSNLGALIEAARDPGYPAQIKLVLSPLPDSPAVERARVAGIPVEVVPPGSGDYADHMLSALRSHDVGWICLAGLTTKVPDAVVDAYQGRILNIHPALLPRHGGPGMYGKHVHRAVIASGDQESGCSVHIVTHGYDEGPVVLQLRCPVNPGDTPESLAARVLELEHRAFPLALRTVIEGYGRSH